MTAEQLTYSQGRLRDLHLVTGGDAATGGIGVLTPARAQATLDFMASAHLLDAGQVDLVRAYDFGLSRAAGVMP